MGIVKPVISSEPTATASVSLLKNGAISVNGPAKMDGSIDELTTLSLLINGVKILLDKLSYERTRRDVGIQDEEPQKKSYLGPRSDG